MGVVRENLDARLPGAPMIILGLDPGSVDLGYGIIGAHGQQLSYMEGGIIHAPAGHDKYTRLAEIGSELEGIFGEFSIDAVAIEAGFVKGQMGALTSGAARGVAGYIARRRGVSVTEYAPTTVKKAVAGHGHAEKSSVARAVQLRLAMKRTPEKDAGDALAVAICHALTLVCSARSRPAA